MAPKVSILAPCYNHQAFLPSCVASVQAQTLEDWELILLDDGSKDESREIAQQLAREDSRIKAGVNEKNLGTYGTQQKALEMASGQLIAVLNTDDIWERDKLRLQVSLLERRPEASFCFTLGRQINREGEIEEGVDVHSDWPKEEVSDLLPWLLHENRILASSVLFRRSGLRFETSCRYSGDWVALIEASLRGLGACVAEPLSHWRVHGGNAHLMSAPRLVEEIRVREAIFAHAKEWPEARSPEGEKRMIQGLLDILALYAAAGMRGRALRLAPMALRSPRLAKRWGASILPRKTAVSRLWPNSAEAFLSYDPRALRAELESKPPLRFQAVLG